jgi:zinc-ribbon domain
MFCPKCATQNLDGASFCRTCGANISMVPQALTGQLEKPEPEEVVEGKCKTGKKLTLEHSFKNIFMGAAFLLIAIVLSRSGMGQGWWFWMLIPAFVMMGTGTAQYIRLRERAGRASLAAPAVGRAFADRANVFQGEMPTRNPDELRAPAPSVTEGTTRHLGVEAPTRHLDANERK